MTSGSGSGSAAAVAAGAGAAWDARPCADGEEETSAGLTFWARRFDIFDSLKSTGRMTNATFHTPPLRTLLIH